MRLPIVGDMFESDGLDQVYGHGRTLDQAVEAAYDALPVDGHVEVVEGSWTDLATRETYDPDEPDTATETADGYGLKAVELTYWQDPCYDPDAGSGGSEPYHPLDELEGVDHPNDGLSGVRHPLDNFPA
ncbi:MAG: hypothetical protein SV186_04525 [Candidatus Nanohaloarchaea archaeon]|nr:hypothetical protein [Candidatus Nanohaloarchaea archaeon]